MNLKELLQYCKDNAADAQTKANGANNLNETQPSPERPQQYQQQDEPAPETTTARDRAAINRANAQHSTGPKSKSGKGRSALNAVKTALTGRTVLLESDDVELYEAHVRGWFNELKPEGLHETTLVQSIADSHWRNDRIVTIEAAIFSRGRNAYRWENLNCYEHEVAGPTEITVLTDVQVNTLYERELRNLHIQENRLRKQRDNDLKQLEKLQAARHQAEAAQKATPQIKSAKLVNPIAATGPKNPGFVFANRKSKPARIAKQRSTQRSRRRKPAGKNNRKAA